MLLIGVRMLAGGAKMTHLELLLPVATPMICRAIVNGFRRPGWFVVDSCIVSVKQQGAGDR